MAARQLVPNRDGPGRVDGRSPLPRAAVGALIIAAGMGLTTALSYVAGASDWPALIVFAAAIGAGLYVGNWWAVPTAFVGVLGLGILLEAGSFVIMGSSWWEQQNAEHWPGDAPAYAKLLGQLLEYAVFGVFFALLAGAGVVIRRGLGRLVMRKQPPVGA